MHENLVSLLDACPTQNEVTELEYLRRRVKELEKEALIASWKKYPDRMGGQFTRDEIDNAKKAWK